MSIMMIMLAVCCCIAGFVFFCISMEITVDASEVISEKIGIRTISPSFQCGIAVISSPPRYIPSLKASMAATRSAVNSSGIWDMS